MKNKIKNVKNNFEGDKSFNDHNDQKSISMIFHPDIDEINNLKSKYEKYYYDLLKKSNDAHDEQMKTQSKKYKDEVQVLKIKHEKDLRRLNEDWKNKVKYEKFELNELNDMKDNSNDIKDNKKKEETSLIRQLSSEFKFDDENNKNNNNKNNNSNMINNMINNNNFENREENKEKNSIDLEIFPRDLEFNQESFKKIYNDETIVAPRNIPIEVIKDENVDDDKLIKEIKYAVDTTLGWLRVEKDSYVKDKLVISTTKKSQFIKEKDNKNMKQIHDINNNIKQTSRLNKSASISHIPKQNLFSNIIISPRDPKMGKGETKDNARLEQFERFDKQERLEKFDKYDKNDKIDKQDKPYLINPQHDPITCRNCQHGKSENKSMLLNYADIKENYNNSYCILLNN